jgi:hypothetical protein
MLSSGAKWCAKSRFMKAPCDLGPRWARDWPIAALSGRYEASSGAGGLRHGPRIGQNSALKVR